jgi:hypothetical protein
VGKGALSRANVAVLIADMVVLVIVGLLLKYRSGET